MKTYDFIFSDRPWHRISRHLLFWLCWFFFIVLTFHIPLIDVFPNWEIRDRMDFVQKKRGVDFITLRGGLANLIWEISYKQLRILFCQIAFTYAIIYYILPQYISKKKEWLSTTLKLVLIFAVFLALEYFVIWKNFIDNAKEWFRRTGQGGLQPSPETIISHLQLNIIFNLSTLVVLTVSIKLLKRWWLKQKETEQIAREKLNAELQLLKAQVHPHFLFNSLNNIYAFALERSPKTQEMIQKLSGLLHYMLYECKSLLVSLEKEVNMIRNYISLEKIRYGDRLKLTVDILPVKSDLMIAPLLLIPFVENSFKHGTSKMLSQPEIIIHISEIDNIINFKLTNSQPTLTDELNTEGNHGLGLKNVKKRLGLLYPGQFELEMINDTSLYTVNLKIDLTVNSDSAFDPAAAND